MLYIYIKSQFDGETLTTLGLEIPNHVLGGSGRSVAGGDLCTQLQSCTLNCPSLALTYPLGCRLLLQKSTAFQTKLPGPAVQP